MPRFTRTGTPAKRAPGPHMLVTEAQTLDEALDILRKRQTRPQEQTVARENVRIKRHNEFVPVTLSDRTMPARIRPPAVVPRGPDVVWTQAQVVKAYDTKQFNIAELSRRAKVHPLQIWLWVMGPHWRPLEWNCQSCKKIATDTITAKTGGEPKCHRCGTPWDYALTHPRIHPKRRDAAME